MPKKTYSKECVYLRQRSRANGLIALYLDINTGGRRRSEYLRLYLVPENTREDRAKNRETLKVANAIKAQRIIDVQREKQGLASSGEHVKTNGKVHLVRGKDGTWNMVVRDGEGVKERPEGTTTKEERASAPYAGNVEMDGYDAMRQLMGDGRVSEAARAKCYWILTGRTVPMSTVAGWQTEEHGDGTYTVRSVTADGDVITSRRFKNRRDAQGEEMKIRRQAEYNTVEVGERYADRRAFEAAAEDVAGEYGTTAEAVRNAAANVEAGKGTAGEQEIYNRYGEAMEARRSEMSAEAIRTRIEDENECSIDAILGKSPDKRTEAEQAVVERYLDELYPDRRESNENDRSTGNAENTGNAGGDNGQKRLPGAVVGELPFEGPTGPTGPNDTGAPEDANAGRAGNVPTAEAEAARAEAMSAAYEALEEAFGGREDLLADVKDDPWETLRDPELTGEQREAVVQYLNNVTSGSDGNNENNAGSVQPTWMTSEVATATARRINHESGMVVPARIAAIGNAPAEDVYIVSGEVRMQPDGSAIDRGNSDSFIVVCDAEGNYHATSPERLESVGEAVTPEQWAQTLENIRQQDVQTAANARTQQQTTEAAAMRPQFALNDELPPDDITGNVETAQNNEPVGVPAPTNGAEVTSAEEPLSPEPTPEPTALSRVPTDAKGEPMFEQAEDAATAWDALVEYSGGDVATAKEIAAVMAQEKRKEYERARKLKPKGKTPAEILASKRDIVAEQSRTQLEYERWRQMAEVERGREAAEQAEREAAARREAAEQAERERAERVAQAEADRLRLERLNGVPDWRADTPEHARARGYRRSGPEVVERQGAVPAVRGKDVRVKFAKDTTADGVAAVIDVDDLQPSHVQGVRNVRHFIPEAQPKDRKDAVSKVSAQDIAWNIRPEEITGSITAYTGAPSVNARGETIQGNSRADALKWMYDNAPEQAARYKAYLVEHAADFGMDAADIEAMERPVLVNMLDVSDGEAIRLGQYVQADTESGGVERIRGRVAARKMGADMREYAKRLLSSEDEDASISQLVAANGVKTLQWMNTRGYITDTQYASCFDRKGELTGNAAEDLKDVLYQGIFEGGSVEIEEMFAKLPAKVQRAILATAYRDYDSPEADSIRGEIQQAIVLYNEMMMYPQYAGAMNVESALTAVAAWSQQYAFDEASGESYLPAERFSNFALHLAAMYKGMSQRGLQKMFNNLYDTIQGVGEDTLFESVERTPHTIAEVVKKVLGIDYKPVNERNNGETGHVPVADDSEVGQRGGRGSTTDVGSRERVTGTGRAYERGAGAAAAGAGAGGVGFSEGGDPVGRSLSEREATELVGRMEAEAEVAPMVELTPENWLAQFGEDGMVDTPIGVVKMGENQFIKMYSRGRAEYFGMVYPTLYTPDVVLEEVDPKDGSERDSKYLFVKTFVEADGARIVHFESVTVKKDGMEVSISSHEIKDTAVKNKMQNDKILHLAEKLSPGSEWRLTETPSGSKRPDLVPASDGTSLRGKDTTKSSDVQEKSDNIVGGQETPMSAKIKTASAEVNTDPTEAQKEAGNYKKGHVQVGTFDITIEQPQGSVRKGTDADGKQWESKMNNTYGYIRGAVGVDGDHIDVFLSNDIDGWNGRKVFVVDQYNPDGSFDEHKVMLGFNDQDEAKGDYLANYEQGWENGRRIDITGVNLEDFEKWIESSKRKTKPFGEYSSVKKDVVEINAPEEAGYSITPSTYTNKKGKTSDVSLLTFNHDLTADQERAVKEFAKERIGEGRFAPARGWKDRESGGWVFRSEEDARKAAEMVGNEEAVADNQPMTAQELRDAVEPKKPTTKTASKKPANRVESVPTEEPIEPEKPKYEVSDEEMNGLMNDIRDILGIGDDEGDAGFKFRDPDELTAEQRQKLMSVGQRLAMAMVERGNESFGDYASMMVKALGDKVRPWLKAFYGGLEYVPGYDKYALTPYEEVKAFDVENFDKPTKDVMAQANMIVEEGKAQVAAEKANKELKATRNEQRKETEKQTAANTDAVAAEAKSVASEATALAETSSDEQTLTGAAERVDETLDKVNEQLALLGYYEADEVEKDYNEAYGYMRNAEKKAVKDAANLASQLIDDLGLDRFEATHSDKTDKKGNRKAKPLAVANIAPAGGDITIHLPLAEGRELYVNIQLEPAFDKGDIDRRGDNLEVTGIMCRVENPNASGNDRYGQDMWFAEDVTYDDLLKNVQRATYKYIPERSNTKEREYKAGDKVQYSPDGNIWHDAVVAQPNDEGGIRIDTGLAPVMWVNAHPDQLRHKAKEVVKPQTEDIANNPQSWVGRTFNYNGTQLVCKEVDGNYATFDNKATFMTVGFEVPTVQGYLKSGKFQVEGDKPTEPQNEDIFQKAERIAKEAREKNAAKATTEPTATPASAEQPKPATKKKTSKKKVKPEQTMGNLFAGLFDEPNNNETADSNSSSPSQTLAGAERPDTVGIDETGTDGAERTTAVAGIDGERSTDASRENGREAADGAVHGTDEVGGIQPPVGNRGRDESAADGTVSNGATNERGRVAGPRTVQTGEIDGGGKELSSGEPASSTGEGSRPSAVKKQRTPVRKFTNNFHYGTDGNEADNYTPAQRLEGNVSAIEVIAKLFKEGRKATDEEKQILSRFRGWGQIDQLNKFYSVDQMRRDTYGNSPYRRLANAIDTLDPDGKKGVFAGIRRAALSSYYTPTKIASAMNSFLSLAGFKGGTFLDPSMGSGIFEGTLPKDIQERTMITGIELDWLSGQISRALYPDADVRICGFEKSELTPNSQDVVTSNVPFGDIEVNDPTWKNDSSPVKRSAQKRIHNYYAVKMLELTRPGGIVAMMTSPAVMDTQSNQHIRRYIAEQGEFLGAVRLPDNTFQGTGAMADIIYIRKWKDEEDAQKTRENPDYAAREQAFLSSAETTAPNKRNGEKQKVSHNAYYASNRKNMIGDVVAGNQYNDTSFGLHSELTTDQIAKEVEKAVKRIVGDRKGMLFDTTRTSREVKQAVREEYKGDGNWVSTGNLVIQDGKVGVLTATKNEYGEVTRVFEEQPQLAKQKKRIIAMGEVRTAMKELIAGQIDGLSDTKLNMLRAKLKRAYDEFVSKYGKLQDTDNAVVLSDIDGYTLQALEVWKGGKFQGLSDIFTKNTIKPALKLEDAKTPQEAITTSLAEYGEIRGEYIEKALGANWFEQCGDLVFKEPNATDRYVTRDEYLSGDVVAKLEEAKTAAATDPTFERNVKELEQVQPATIPFDDITIHLGARWIPQEVLNDFMKDTLGLHASSSRNYEWVDGERREIIKSGVVYVPETDTFEINIEAKELGGQADDWETADKSIKEIFQAALEDKDFRIVRQDKDGNKWIDQEATELANSKVAELRERFEQWLPSDEARVQTMERAYNDRFNRIVLRKWDGSHLNVPGLMGKELRPHQKDAVWMLINNRGGIVDHIVGAGKTLVMQSAIMEMRRMGIAKKPMIVALKSTVPQIAREFKEAYPTARVLAPSEKDFSTENRKKFFAKISLNDYDCIIVSHEQYCKIPHSEEAEGDVVNEQLAQLDAMIEYLYGTGDKSQLTKRQIKSLEKRRQNLQAKLEKRLDRSTDREFCFENMGIDYLFVDECHQFKSLPYVTSYQNVAGLGEASGSNKAVALLTGIRHLQKMHQGDKGTVFLSGTTITNSLVEVYNLLNYLRPRKLEQLGMPTFDAWASTFAVHSSELEAGVSNEFKMKDRFRYFDNVPELSQLYAEIADVRNDYNLQLPKPKVDGKTVIVPQSDAVAEINREVVNMLQTKDGSYFGIHPKDKNKFPWGLVASGISAKAAVSPRLVFPEMDDSVGKISYCCDNIKKAYDEMKEQKGVQLVFCEIGVPTKGKEYDAYHDIINRLTKDYGIPREEIAYIQQVKNDTEKEALFQKVRDGKVRILIGGTRNMGTGVNVQTRITDLHMLTVPWQPADLEQCIGRGSRQGNVVAHDFLNNKVRVHYYATEGSLDLYKYQLLDAKGKMFTQFKMGTISGERSFDEGDADENGNIDPAQMVALLSGNPIIFEKSKQDKLVKKLKSLYNGFLRDQQRKRQNYETVTKKVDGLKRLISLSDSDVHNLQREGFKPDEKGTYPSKVKVCVEGSYYGQDFDKPKEAGQYILEQLKNNKKVVLAGFGQRADVVFVTGDDLLSSHYEVQIGGNNAWSIRYSKRMPQDPTQAGLVFRSLLEQIIHNNEVYHREYDTNSEMLKTMPKGDAPFPKQKELDEAIAKQKELDAEYNKLGQSEEDKTKFRLLDDDDPMAIELESLPESELVPVYRNVQVFEDDALGSPMAFTDAETGERRTLEGRRWNYSAPPKVELTEEQQRKLDELNKNGYIMVDGKKSTELQINDGLKFVKPKTKEAQLQYFLKKNPEDKGLWAAYDPYDHAIETPLNTQFGEAYKRPNLVVVRSLIPKSEIDEPFHADYALLPTGAHQWNNGRTLYLSRWSKIDKVLTREEEAKLIDEYWKKHPGKREELKTHRDYNRFVPQVRRELEKMGYRFELDGKELTPKESLALDKQNWDSRDIIPGREGRTPFVSNEDIARINAKMAGKWVGEPKEAMESAMSERVTELSERLHTPVRIIRTEEEVAALPSVRQRRMKGSFNPMTGEVTIVVPNNANMADIENTFVHEVVGHDGLRVLFPDKAKLNNALDELYRVSKDEIRGTIDRMAQKMYDAEVDRIREKKRKEHVANGEDANASYYADMAAAHAEAGKKREQYRRDATEEYGADLAGRIGESGFEKMSAAEQTFWGRLKAMLQKALQRLLDGLKIRSKRQWGDKEWAFVLHEAFKRKRRGGGRPTVFDMADTEVMRRKTGFGEMSNVESYGRDGKGNQKETVNLQYGKRLGQDNDEQWSRNGGRVAGEGARSVARGGGRGDIRVFEKGLASPRGEYTVRSERDRREAESERLVNVAKENGLYMPKERIRDLGQRLSKQSRESEVYISDGAGKVYKVKDPYASAAMKPGVKPEDAIYEYLVHNKYFPETAYTFEGITDDLGDVRIVLSQDLVRSTKRASARQVAEYLAQKGLKRMDGYHFGNDEVTVTDVEGDNALIDENDKVRIIDPVIDFRKPTREILGDEPSDNGIKFRDGDDGLGKAIAQMKDAASLANTNNRQAKENAMKAIGGNLSMLRQAMARQRGYDLSTVKSITDLAKRMLENGLLDDLGKAETKRILSAAANVTGREDTSKYVQKVMDIMVDNQLRRSRDALGRLLSIRGKRVDGRGIEVQGALDANGVAVLQAFKKSKGLDWATIDERISDAFNRMGSEDDALAEEATLEYSGLVFARQYVSDITESVSEEKGLREDLRQAKEDHVSGRLDDASYRQFVSATEEAIRDNKVERAEAYRDLIERLGGELGESAERARQWREAEKVRVGEIHHNANSDMEGRPTDEHHKSTAAEKLANNDLVRFLLAPLATFDQMLRMFGRKSVRGEGYLWNRYMRGWEEATSREYTGYRDALRELDAKVSEVFGKKMLWGDLFTLERHMDGGSVRFWDGGEMKEHKLTQGNLLYIYMVDKMSDGRMKLRHMGITEGDVEAVKALLDPRFVRLADWLQDEFLVKKRNKYNEVHKRMFGTSMAAIENYFPLKILANARTEQIDINDESTTPAQPSTSTGSIIKRRRNKLALDITGADAFSVILDHLQEMERWAAFAEYNRDLNALLSYKRFRNQVLNMNSAYGSGRVLWNNFRDVCRMAAGAYRPPVAKLDKAAVNIAKGVTAAKVSFRVFTALKQLLSMPAYISDCNPVHFAANLANPVKAWEWCMKNLPLFEKRWRSRMAGDPRLLKSEMDWRAWRSRVVEISSRIGMSPNAFVDALAVAIGTRAMYQTKKAKYMRWGMSETAADARAKQDATILFNQTQQSSEGAFLSTLQVDHSWLSVLFTVFRNASMSYTRQQYDAFRNLGHRLQPGYKSQSLEFMAKQFERDGIEQGNAVKAARQEYYRGVSRDLARVAVFGYILQLAWNLGAYLPYLLLGNDDDEKDAMWEDVWNHTAFGSIEGLTGGDVYSSAGQMWLNGDMKWSQLVKDMPIASDLAGIYSKMGSDKVSAINDVINLLVQSGIGVNPQSLTDAVAAIMDYSNGDADTSREYALMVARVLNCPQSQLDKVYFDELDATAREASMMTPAEIAQRYAEYKALRGAPLTGWMRSEAQQDSVEGRWRKRALTVAREKLDNRVATEKTKMLLGQYDSLNKRKNDIGKLRKGNVEEYRKELRRLYRDNDFRIYYRMQRYKRDIKEQTERYLRTQSTRERDSLVRSMMSTRDRMLQDVEALEDTPQ